MSTQEAGVFLTAEKVQRLAEILPFTQRQKATFNERAQRFNTATTLLEGLTADFSDQFSQTAAKLDPFVATVDEAKSSVKRAETVVSEDNSSPGAILRRTRHQAIGNPRFNPPWYLRALKHLAISEPPPSVAAEITNQQSAERQLTGKTTEVDRELQRVRVDLIPKIDGAAFCVDDATANLLATCRRSAITSSTAVEDFIRIVPEQADQTAEDYAKQHYDSPEELVHFQDFVHIVYRLFKPGLVNIPSYKIAPEKYPELDPKVQSCWRAFVAFRKLQQLADKGIIEQPEPPEIFNRLAAILPL